GKPFYPPPIYPEDM
uniref:Tryptophyllin-13 n=1 Tax=Bombina variegata TaxID=8348 RepID=TY13_BOMVA|nr:RecName: Full=Tryptophyllin-13 [Bombina variegata]